VQRRNSGSLAPHCANPSALPYNRKIRQLLLKPSVHLPKTGTKAAATGPS